MPAEYPKAGVEVRGITWALGYWDAISLRAASRQLLVMWAPGSRDT